MEPAITSGYSTPEQLDEHRLEIENRIRNLFWTVSGDYSLEIQPDIYDFARSRYIPLYDAIKQGAFARYFDPEELSLYLAKKVCLGAAEQPLMELAQLCMEEAVFPHLARDREGVTEIRLRAFEDIYRSESGADAGELPLIRQVKRVMMHRILADAGSDVPTSCGDALPTDSRIPQIIAQIHTLRSASSSQIPSVIDRIYNTFLDPGFESRSGDLQRVLDVSEHTLLTTLEQEFLDDDTMDNSLKKILKSLRRDMLRMEIPSDRRRTRGLSAARLQNIHFAELSEEDSAKVAHYVDLSFGRSYLTENEQRALSARHCRGIHHGCRIHWTEGILHAAVLKNNQYRYAEMLTNKNQMYYYMNNRAIRRNINDLADTLKKMLALKSQQETWRDRTGQLVPSRLWKLHHTEDDKLFDRSSHVDESGFVVDILLDASGSQLKRQGQLAAQGFIISEALTAAGIPHRMISFCTFWDYTILHRFRDYEDKAEKNKRVFEYTASANNRDGLAIRAVTEDLNNRPEGHKILIVLSDGRPNDLGRSSQSKRVSQPYVGEEAVKDTAFEVRRARSLGIAVLGIFAGSSDDLYTEKKIFGKDFAYIQKLNNFSHVVGTYLCRQIDAAE